MPTNPTAPKFISKIHPPGSTPFSPGMDPPADSTHGIDLVNPPTPLSSTSTSPEFESLLKILPAAISVWSSKPKYMSQLRASLVLSSPKIHQIWSIRKAVITHANYHPSSLPAFFFRHNTLRALHMRSCNVDEAFITALNGLTLLQSLTLMCCPMTIEPIDTELTPLLNLRTLIVNKCSNMDACFSTLLASLSNLCYLEWFYCAQDDLSRGNISNPVMCFQHSGRTSSAVTHCHARRKASDESAACGPWLVPGQMLTELSIGLYRFGTAADAELGCFARLTALHSLKLTCCLPIHPRTLQSIASLPALQDLVFDNCQSVCPEAFRLMASLTQLTCLHLFGYNKLDALDMCHIRAMTNLAELQLMMRDVDAAAALREVCRLPKLEVLDLSDSDDMTPEALCQLSRLTRLRRLDLSNCSGVDADGLYCISFVSTLQELFLSYCWCMGVVDLQHLSRLAPSLTTLDISGFWPEEDDEPAISINHIVCLTNLRVLDLSSCFDSLDPTTFGELSKLTSLTDLDVSENCWVTSLCLQNLAKISSLHTLNLSGCSEVDSVGMRYVAGMPLLTKLLLDSVLEPPRSMHEGVMRRGRKEEELERMREVLTLFPDTCQVEC